MAHEIFKAIEESDFAKIDEILTDNPNQAFEMSYSSYNIFLPAYQIAIRQNKADVVKHLIEKHKVNASEALFKAIYSEKAEIVRKILEQQNLDLNSVNEDGETPFYLACRAGMEEIALILLEDPRVEINDISKGIHPLFANILLRYNPKLVEKFVEDKRLILGFDEKILFNALEKDLEATRFTDKPEFLITNTLLINS